ncbi:hypothetical protein EMIT0347P_10431 [Pseudomonas sp. IT-347P]
MTRTGSLSVIRFRCCNHQATLPSVGVSLLAIAVCQPPLPQLTHRYREQAHSYRGLHCKERIVLITREPGLPSSTPKVALTRSGNPTDTSAKSYDNLQQTYNNVSRDCHDVYLYSPRSLQPSVADWRRRRLGQSAA